MKDFYFTYGSDERYPFRGGWTRITAQSINVALNVFVGLHPNRDGCLNCCHYYTEEEFNATSMPNNGNLGAFEHEHITVDIEYPNKEKDR